VPLVALCFWIGIYPKPFLAFLDKPMAQLAERVQPGRFEPAAAGPQTAATHAVPEPPVTQVAEPTVVPDPQR
jgi:hypothetical protein